MLFDSNLSFDSHVSSICKTEFFHLKNISKPVAAADLLKRGSSFSA